VLGRKERKKKIEEKINHTTNLHKEHSRKKSE